MTTAAVLIPAIIWAVAAAAAVAGVLTILWRCVRAAYHANKATALQDARFWAAWRKLRDANDAVIAQLEADHSLRGFIPGDVRDAIYAAHDVAATTERNTHEWSDGRSLP